MINLKAAAALLLCLAACSKKSKNELYVYTSTYKEVLALYDPYLKQRFPEFEVQWFQAGSEVITTKIQAELSANRVKADLLMTSDLFFAQELARGGHLAKLDEAHLAKMDKEYRDPNGSYVISRFPVMVIAYNKTKISEVPKSFSDLVKPVYKDKLTMPSPLESGSTMTAVMSLRKTLGDEYFKKLRANNILAAGGNGSTLSRILSGEKPLGIVLMENVLQAREKGSSDVEFVVPSEGAVAIPSPLAIFKGTKNMEAAKKLFDWFLSDEAQRVLIKGWVYSPFPHIAAPQHAPSWTELKKQPWDLALFEKWGSEKQATKDFFQTTVLR